MISVLAPRYYAKPHMDVWCAHIQIDGVSTWHTRILKDATTRWILAYWLLTTLFLIMISNTTESLYLYSPSHILPAVFAAVVGLSLVLHIYQN
jgi:hypothetical protein